MNLKNTPKPWQICVEIAISFGLTVGIAEIADLLWSAIGGGFKSFAVIVLMAIAFVIIAMRVWAIVCHINIPLPAEIKDKIFPEK